MKSKILTIACLVAGFLLPSVTLAADAPSANTPPPSQSTGIFGAIDNALPDAIRMGGATPAPSQTANPFNKQLVGTMTLPTGYNTNTNPLVLTGQIIMVAMSFLGVTSLAFVVYAGYLWMTAAGNDEQVSSAKATLRNALIGLILILMAYSLTWYFVTQAQVATQSYGQSSSLF